MEHPFCSRRDALATANHGLAVAADVMAIASMKSADRAKVLARREPEVADAAARAALARRAGRLGLLLEDLDACGAPSSVAKPHGGAWERLLRGDGGGSSPFAALVRGVEEARAHLTRTRDELAAVEHDTGSSSYSDYSDSRTVSSDDDDDDDTTPESKRRR